MLPPLTCCTTLSSSATSFHHPRDTTHHHLAIEIAHYTTSHLNCNASLFGCNFPILVATLAGYNLSTQVETLPSWNTLLSTAIALGCNSSTPTPWSATTLLLSLARNIILTSWAAPLTGNSSSHPLAARPHPWKPHEPPRSFAKASFFMDLLSSPLASRTQPWQPHEIHSFLFHFFSLLSSYLYSSFHDYSSSANWLTLLPCFLSIRPFS